MELSEEFGRYLGHISASLGRAERKAGLQEYCRALMLPLKRKSIEPLAAAIDPYHGPSLHQSLHHFVADSPWSDEAVLGAVRSWVLPRMAAQRPLVFLIADDSGMPKQGTHSVGVARQYCGQLGKTANCQVAVSLSLATVKASLPIAYRLYLPEAWTQDRLRCRTAGVPAEVKFATKPQLSLSQIRAAKEAGLPGDVVAADAAYGDDTDYRDGISALGLLYVVGIKPGTTVWAPGTGPLPPKRWSGRGRKPTLLRRNGTTQRPLSVKQLAMSLKRSAYRKLTWREGTNTKLSSRFATVRVRAAHRDYLGDTPRDEEWLLIEWPKGESEPTKYFLSTLSAAISRKQLVAAVKIRWRIERDYQELKQEFGLDNFEGRNWRGFHHHATLCIAAYGFLVGERLAHGQDAKKNSAFRAPPSLPEGYAPRGAGSSATTRR